MILFKLFYIILFSNIVFCYKIDGRNANETKKPSPLVIVPGDGGSRAYADIKYFFFTIRRLLWVNYEYMVFPGELTSDFKLIYNPTTHTTNDVESVKIIFPGWGSTEMIEELDECRHPTTIYFTPLVQELIKDKFYQRNKTLRGAPYDFRKAPDENLFFVNSLKDLIEDTYYKAGNERVVLLGHSMGSLYSLYFFNKMSLAWKKKYVRSFVSASGPLGGAVKAVKLETTGDALGSPRSPYWFREMQRSFPSTALLLPKYSVFGDTPIVITPKKNYSANDFPMLFKDMNFPIGGMMYNDIKDLVDGSKTPEGIDELYCIYSYGLSTTEQLVFTNFPDEFPRLIVGNGDGTVNLRSLEVCKQWTDVKYYAINGSEHMHIVGDPQFISKIKSILYKKPNLGF